MESFFVRFLPSDDELKENDFILWKKEFYLVAKQLGPIASDLHVYMKDGKSRWIPKEDIPSLRPYKYFLCTRDIQIGDEVLFQLAPNVSPWQKLVVIDKWDDEHKTIILKDGDVKIYTSNDNWCCKIKGPISSGAGWVRNGDELASEQIKIWMKPGSISSRTLTELSGHPWSHKEDRIQTPPTVADIQVKCPFCDCFK